jgi:membrane protease YdiL (CAAX protease family)
MSISLLQRSMLLAAVALALWNGAFAISAHVGIWGPIAAAALALDALCLILDPGLRRWRAPGGRVLAIGVAAAAVQIAATYSLFPIAARAWPGLTVGVADLYRLLGAGAGALLAAPTALVAASEELVFRGTLQTWLSRSAPAWVSVLGAAVVYTLCHLASGEIVLLVLAFVCGAFWGALRAATGSLVPGILAHIAWDMAVLFVYPLRLE